MLISDPVLGLDFFMAQTAPIDLNEMQIALEPLSSVQVLGHLDQHIDGIRRYLGFQSV